VILPHKWEVPKKSAVLSSAPKLCTVHNHTGAPVYCTVYDKSRALYGQHFRIAPVFEIGEQPAIFEKPFLRGSRSIWLLLCRNPSLWDERETILSDAKFYAFPQICIDFTGEIVVRLCPRGGLEALTKVAWEKDMIRRQRIPTPSKAIPPKRETETPFKVRLGTALGDQEKEFLGQRLKVVTPALESFLGMSMEGKYSPRIAFCGSGGGCRSMVSTLGFLIGMENAGLLDCCSFVSGVSGSTWTMALWFSLGQSPGELRENISTKFSSNLVSRPNAKGASELLSILKQKWTPGSRTIGLVDIYGAQLSAGLLHDTEPPGSEYRLSYQTARLQDGSFPLPIYTAVQRQVDGKHNWFEFTPYEVGSASISAFVPTEGFGRYYDRGLSLNNTPEPSLGLLLGMFGSAFCAPIQRVSDDLFDRLHIGSQHQLELEEAQIRQQQQEGGFTKMLLDYRETVEGLIDQFSLQHTSLLAASRFANFAYDPSVEASRQRDLELDLYDAGIDFNLPFPVLLRPERGIDIIIACESSKCPDINTGRALRVTHSFCYHERRKLSFGRNEMA
jgi:hypothetical protein